MAESKLDTDAVLQKLDHIRAIAVEGLNYAASTYDLERYTQLLQAVSELYGSHLDTCPSDVRARLSKELGSCTPKVGVNVAVLSTASRLLVLRRSDDGTWCLPCGWVGVGEPAEQAARRETEEETGFNIHVRGVIDLMEKLPLQGSALHHQLNVLFVAKPVDESPVRLSHEHSASAWISDTHQLRWHPGHQAHAERALRFAGGLQCLMQVQP